MSASQELEQAATKYALEAVRLDKQGSRGMAITMYQKGISTLLKLVRLYPDYGLNSVYIQRAQAYQDRIKALQGEGPVQSFQPQQERSVEMIEPPAETGTDGKASYDELVLDEKPNVRWSQVVGLDPAKKAIKEAIVYPVERPDLFPLGWPRGILLFGPPGCGKTLVAAAVATEIDAAFISVDAASIMSKWLGEAEKNVAKLFTSARKVPLPDHDARLSMLKLYTEHLNLSSKVDLDEFARLSGGFSGSDIRDICQSAHLRVIGELFDSGKASDKHAKPRPISMDDFKGILEDRKPSVSPRVVSSYNEWSEAFKAL